MLEVYRNGLIHNRIKKINTNNFISLHDEIAGNTSLRELEITTKTKHLPKLSSCLAGKRTLQKLGVSNRHYRFIEEEKLEKSMEDIYHFIDAIVHIPLSSLKLDGIVFPSFHFDLLGKYLSSQECVLQELYFRNFIEAPNDEGQRTPYFRFDKLVPGLIRNTTLTTLSFEQNGVTYVTDFDLKALTQLFTVNKTITSFHLITNNMRCAEVSDQVSSLYDGFVDALSQSNVTQLTLSCIFNLRNQTELLYSYNLSSLTLLNFGYNNCPPELRRANADHISELILRSSSLYSLSIDSGFFLADEVKVLCEALSQNPTLSSLSFNFMQQDYQFLSEGLMSNTNLTNLPLKNHRQMNERERKQFMLCQNIVRRNHVLQSSLFNSLFYLAGCVSDSDFEDGFFVTRKHPLHLEDNSNKRQK